MATPTPPRFQFTGSLLPSSVYIRRPVDARLLAALSAGKFCHVVAPRQIGKSSLRASVTRALAARGFLCVSFDMTALGKPGSADEWYFSLADEIARQLDHPDARDLWDQRQGVTAALRWRDFLRHTLAREPDKQLVLLLDEIESVKLVDFPIDDFFPTLRSISEARASDPDLARLTICLTGVTSPSDLIDDKDRTPYSVSEAIEISDFTRAELDDLAPGFAGLDVDLPALIDAIHEWTGGHPYMTMKVSAKLVELGLTRGSEREAVDRVVREQFLGNYLRDPNLSYAARRFDDPKYAQRGAALADKIELYRQLLAGQAIPAQRRSELQVELMLCGMVKIVDDHDDAWLRPRNRVFATVFDLAWLRARGQRRYLAEAIWAWLDSNKEPSALLRGKILDDAVAWSKTGDPSREEQEFLAASLEQQRVELEIRRGEIKAEVVQIEAQRASSEAAYRAQVARARRVLLFVAALFTALLVAGVVGLIYFQREASRLATTIDELGDEMYAADRDLNAAELALVKAEEAGEAAQRDFLAAEHDRTATLSQLKASIEKEEALLQQVTAKESSLSAQSKQLLKCERERRHNDDSACNAQLATSSEKWAVCEQELTAVRKASADVQGVLGQLKTCKVRLTGCNDDLTRCVAARAP